MKANLEGMLLNEKRARAMYRVLLVKGDIEKAEKLNEVYDLNLDLEENLDFIYKSFTIAGKDSDAEGFAKKYNLNTEKIDDLETNPNNLKLANNIYQFVAGEMHNHHNKLISQDNCNQRLHYHLERQKAYNVLKGIVKNTRIIRKPDADYNKLLDKRGNETFKQASKEHYNRANEQILCEFAYQ